VAWQKAAPAAGRPTMVRLSTEATPSTVRVTVEDSGPGLTDEARARLFEPFFSTKRNGTGLGLSTAQRFVGAHGGRIDAGRSEWGGARFVMVLPVEKPAAPKEG
jgi:signal transduction histidine kinase